VKKRIEKLEHAIPRRPAASSRAMLREMPEAELRRIVREGIQQDSEPTSEISHRLREMSEEDFEALTRGRRVIRNQIGDREN